MKVSVDERDLFEISGPTHLSDPQWSDPNYKRAILASLVQSVYVMEKDRQLSLSGVQALAPKWWISFHYKPIKLVHDDEQEEHIVGAVFKWNRKACLIRPAHAPKVVIAFRGTMPQGDTLKSDLTADFHLILQQLQRTSRFLTALNEVMQAVKDYGVEKVAIAGHSLGAAVCMVAGRILAERGSNLEAHLFNPPFVSASVEKIKSNAWKKSLRVIGMVAIAGLAKLVLDEESQKQAYDAFLALKDWYPQLYVNVGDPICSSYIGYFTSRQFLSEVGTGALARLVAPHSFTGLLRSLFKESSSYHLIPSAHLHIVEKSSKKFKKLHGMQQWWSPQTEIRCLQVSFEAKEYSEKVGMEQER